MRYNRSLCVSLIMHSNFWYIPALALLVALKLCLVSFLVSCIKPDGVDDWKNRRYEDLQVLHSKRGQNKALRSHMNKSKSISPTVSHVNDGEWKLLKDLKKAHITPTHANRTNPEGLWLIFNRVPRCGGGTMVELLEKLSDTNRFAHQQHEYRTPWPRFLVHQEQESLVTWFEYQHLPKSYDRHFFFVNFTKYQKYVKERPIYINMLRDPVHRLQSEFLARRKDENLARLEMKRRDKELPGSGHEWFHQDFETCVLTAEAECDYKNGSEDFTLSIPFFCGQHSSCVLINDKWSLQMAKFILERHYSVVGLLERMDQTLTVLENYIPKFFAGATQLYNQLGPGSSVFKSGVPFNQSPPISAATRRILETKLYAEVELYRFASQRLNLQYAHLKGTY